jgi:molecular chaperone Hsp33
MAAQLPAVTGEEPAMSAQDDISETTTSGQSRRFLFEEADIRGELVRLDGAYRDILAIHQYAPGVSRLLGEFLAAAVLLSGNLKFEGRLTLQARSRGQIPLLMAECDHEMRVRGIARGAEQATSDDNTQLLRDGQLAITIDPNRGRRYQGIVPLQQESIALSLDTYFEQSEQLSTRLWLAADGSSAGGLLLQQLPAAENKDEEERAQQWKHACSLAATVQPSELLHLHGEELLYRLYHEESVRLFEPLPVHFQCSCSRERTRHILGTLDPSELLEIIEETGVITMDCEFCNQQYRFESTDLPGVLEAGESKTLH